MIHTGISSSLLRPQTFHVITYLQGGRGLVPLPQRACLIGPMLATGTATVNEVVELDDPTQTDTLFGQGSVMALMARKAFETVDFLGQGPALFAVPLAETTDVGAAKLVKTITLAGTATEDRDLVIRIAGRYFRVGVTKGTLAANVATALNAEIQKQYSNLMFTSGVAAAVVTCTANLKGVIANDATFETVQTPAGITVVFAQTTAGNGVTDMQPALDAILGQDFDAIASCNHVSSDITEIKTHITTTWAASEKKPRWFFIGEPGTIGTATTLATAGDHEGVEIMCCEGSRSMPYEIAAASAVGALSRSRPNANYDGMLLPLYPPTYSKAFTSGEVETALGAGVTPLTPILDTRTKSVVEGVLKVERLITSRTTDANSNAYTLTRDFGVSRTAWYMAKQYDLRYAAQFGAQANPDGVLDDEDVVKQIRAMVIGLNYDAQADNILKNVDADKAQTVAEDDASVSGRVNVDVKYTIVVGLHQVAYIHRATVGG